MSNAAISMDRRIETDRVRALYAQTIRTTIPPAAAATVIVLALWETSDPLALLFWYALILTNCTLRLVLYRRFLLEPDDLPRAGVWARRFAWTTFASGAIFGSLAVFFFPEGDLVRQMFIVFTIGIASTAAAAVAYYPPASLLFLCALFAPVAWRFSVHSDGSDGFVFVGLTFLFAILLNYGFGQGRMLRELIVTRRRNLDLIEALRHKSEVAETAQRKAEQASLAKSHFFAAASHDLRQPLHALGLFAASLRDAKRTAADTEKIDQVLSSVDTLESLFDELLDISKLDAGYIKPSLAHVRASQLFTKLHDMYGAAARKSGLRLRFRAGDAVLHTDAVLVERVLSNLISNALRYTARGGILVGCRRRGREIAIEVRDTGMGIPVHERGRIFDEFYQIGNPERDRRKGLGLGLATVRRIAGLLACRIEVDSRVGSGTLFRVYVPAGDPGRVAAVQPMAEEREVDLLAGTVIVLVEDERAVREGMISVFGGWGCQVVAATSAGEAVEAILTAACTPDAIIADYRLRDHQTGIGAIDALRKQFGNTIPALLVSGDTTPALFKLAAERGLTLLSKPVRAARMRAALLHLFALNRSTV